MKIGIAFDLIPAAELGSGPDDRFEEFDRPETIAAIADALGAEGHEVVLLGNGRGLVERLLAEPPDFVWNMAEGDGPGRCREARVPALLELLGIPYSGSDPLTLAAALDKEVAKQLVRSAGVAVPEGLSLATATPRAEVFDAVSGLAARAGFPLLLKPAFEGSSKGIRARCLVDTPNAACDVFEALAADYEGQPILVEEFVPGDEVTVGIVDRPDHDEGAPPAEVLGVMKVVPKQPSARFVYSLDVKRDWARRVVYEVPADYPEETLRRVEDAALAAYRALGCRDVARIDFRLRDDLPVFLEANPLPGLAPGTSDLVILAGGYGLGHADLIRRILHAALRRVGLVQGAPVAS